MINYSLELTHFIRAYEIFALSFSFDRDNNDIDESETPTASELMKYISIIIFYLQLILFMWRKSCSNPVNGRWIILIYSLYHDMRLPIEWLFTFSTSEDAC